MRAVLEGEGLLDWSRIEATVVRDAGSTYGEEDPRAAEGAAGEDGSRSDERGEGKDRLAGGDTPSPGGGEADLEEAPAGDGGAGVGNASGADAGDADTAGTPAGEAAQPSDYSLRPNGPLPDDEVEALEELAAEIGTLSAELQAGEQRLLELIAEFDLREGWKVFGHRSCADWLAFWTGMDLRTSRERVRVARALERLPKVKEAMGQGALSYSKARAISRLGELEVEDEATMVEFAQKTTAAEVEKLVRKKRMLSRTDEAERERERHARRRLVVFPDGHGGYQVHGQLDPEVGAVLMRALEAASDALYKVQREEPLGPELPTPEQRRADAIGLLAERGLAAGFGVRRGDSPAGEGGSAGPREAPGDRNPSEVDDSQGTKAGRGSAGPREADDIQSTNGQGGSAEPREGAADTEAAAPGAADRDASTRKATDNSRTNRRGGSAEPRKRSGKPNRHHPSAPGPSHCTCGGHPAPILGTRPEHYQVFLHLDPAALAPEGRGPGGESKFSHLEDGTRITFETARRLTCDAAIVPVVQAEDGNVLDIGRSTRVVPPSIRRALYVRDGGCRFPGCGLRFTQPHHVKHWTLGGATSLDNLVSLCNFHHRGVHEDGFEVKALGGGKFKFYSPEGLPLGPEPPRMFVKPGDPAIEIIRHNRRRGIRRPKWDQLAGRYLKEAHIPEELLYRAWDVAEER